MQSFFMLIDTILGLYVWILIASAILSWLVAFNVVNTRNRVVYVIGDVLYRLTEPVLRPLRRVIPNLGGLDISPVITHRLPIAEFRDGFEILQSLAVYVVMVLTGLSGGDLAVPVRLPASPCNQAILDHHLSDPALWHKVDLVRRREKHD